MKIVSTLIFAAVLTAKANAIPSQDSFDIRNSLADDNEKRHVRRNADGRVSRRIDVGEPVETEFLKNKDNADNEYWLFTRKNPLDPHIIINGDLKSVLFSNYAVNRPLVVVVHGWTENGKSDVNTRITAAYLAADDVNVIVVDWRGIADTEYVFAANGVPKVGEDTGDFVNWLINNAGGEWDNVHLIGFSLGAHVVGNAGRTVSGKARRVTGLDPAGPLFIDVLAEFALSSSDGQYVEVIHTNGGVLGKLSPSGDADFYPNGGILQPGCVQDICSHYRSYELFADSVISDNFVGHRCADLSEAFLNICAGPVLNMGNGNLNKNGTGIYGLSAIPSDPSE